MGLRFFEETTLAGINAMSATPATHAPAHATAMSRLPGQPRIRRNPAISTGTVSASHVTAASAAAANAALFQFPPGQSNIPTKGLVGSRTVFVDTRKT